MMIEEEEVKDKDKDVKKYLDHLHKHVKMIVNVSGTKGGSKKEATDSELSHANRIARCLSVVKNRRGVGKEIVHVANDALKALSDLVKYYTPESEEFLSRAKYIDRLLAARGSIFCQSPEAAAKDELIRSYMSSKKRMSNVAKVKSLQLPLGVVLREAHELTCSKKKKRGIESNDRDLLNRTYKLIAHFEDLELECARRVVDLEKDSVIQKDEEIALRKVISHFPSRIFSKREEASMLKKYRSVVSCALAHGYSNAQVLNGMYWLEKFHLREDPTRPVVLLPPHDALGSDADTYPTLAKIVGVTLHSMFAGYFVVVDDDANSGRSTETRGRMDTNLRTAFDATKTMCLCQTFSSRFLCIKSKRVRDLDAETFLAGGHPKLWTSASKGKDSRSSWSWIRRVGVASRAATTTTTTTTTKKKNMTWSAVWERPGEKTGQAQSVTIARNHDEVEKDRGRLKVDEIGSTSVQFRVETRQWQPVERAPRNSESQARFVDSVSVRVTSAEASPTGSDRLANPMMDPERAPPTKWFKGSFV
eukprot:g95.t1